VPENQLILDIYRDDTLLRTRRFEPGEVISIGSGQRAALPLEGEALADVQLLIHRDELGLYQLVELLSTGSRVNGQAGHRAWLPDGSRVQIGGTLLRFWHSDAHRPDPGPALEAAASEAASGEAAVGAESAAAAVEAPAAAMETAAGEDAGDWDSLEDAVEIGPEAAPSAPRLTLPEFLARREEGRSDLGLDRRGRQVLEVAAAWGELVMDVKHFAPGTPEITIGAASGRRLRLLGRHVAWVSDRAAKIARIAGAGLSEVTEEMRADFYVPTDALGDELHALFCWEDGGFELRFREQWEGEVETADGRRSLRALIEAGEARAIEPGLYALPVAPGAQVLLAISGITLAGRMTTAGARVVSSASDAVDRPFAGTLMSAGFLGALLGTLAATAPTSAEAELYEIPDHIVQIMLSEPPAERAKAPPPAAAPSDEPAPGEAAAPGREGKRGREDGDVAKASRRGMERMARDKAIAEDAGVLGFLSREGGLDGVFSSSGLGQGLLDGLAGLVGGGGTQIGRSGLGRVGDGPGGGGTIGVGSSGGTCGRAGEDPRSCGDLPGGDGVKGSGILDLGQTSIVVGPIDRALIDGVIKRHMNQIRYCYQRQLNQSPELSGKIVVKFVIANDGSVSVAETRSSTMASPAVEQCINDRFLRFQFPALKGPGIALVSYPFLFSPG
jgi:hypothetical protein